MNIENPDKTKESTAENPKIDATQKIEQPLNAGEIAAHQKAAETSAAAQAAAAEGKKNEITAASHEQKNGQEREVRPVEKFVPTYFQKKGGPRILTGQTVLLWTHEDTNAVFSNERSAQKRDWMNDKKNWAGLVWAESGDPRAKGEMAISVDDAKRLVDVINKENPNKSEVDESKISIQKRGEEREGLRKWIKKNIFGQ